MKAAIRTRLEIDGLGQLPEGIEVELMAEEGSIPASALDAEFLVPPWGDPSLGKALAAMPNLRVVQVDSAGVEWILPLMPAGITLCNARGLRDRAVAEWVLAAVLAMEKGLPEFFGFQQGAEWRPRLLSEIVGNRALIVGYGSIGAEVDSVLTAVGLDVTRVARRARPGVHPVEELDRLLPDADVVVVLVPLTDETRGLFDSARLARMRAGALLLNASRGAVVDTAALLDSLREGRLRAALDVTDPEPLPPDHALWSAPGTLITPHLAGDSVEAEQRFYRFVGDQIRRFAAGETLQNVVS